MYMSEINLLLYGTPEERSKIIGMCFESPAVIVYHYLDQVERNVSIDDIAAILYTNSGELTEDYIYFLISMGDLTDTEMTAIADLLQVEVSAIWRWK